MQSCLYEGVVLHERKAPIEHRFRYRLAMAYLDLDELAELAGATGLISQRRFAAAGFRESDHLRSWSSEGESLATVVRDHVEQTTGKRPEGAIRLLTQLRYFGHYFSPLNMYYCYSAGGEQLEAVVAEVSNTPWDERYHYVLHEGIRQPCGGLLRYRHPKTFHVSPFMGMDSTYEWRVNAPKRVLVAEIRTSHSQAKKRLSATNFFKASSQEELLELESHEVFFRASMVLHRRELTRRGLRSMLWRYPLMTTRIMAAIYKQAFYLWMKRCPFYPHPQNTTTDNSET